MDIKSSRIKSVLQVYMNFCSVNHYFHFSFFSNSARTFTLYFVSVYIDEFHENIFCIMFINFCIAPRRGLFEKVISCCSIFDLSIFSFYMYCVKNYALNRPF